MVQKIGILFSILLFFSCASHEKEKGLELWYLTPAQEWMQALPIGNGRLGAMVFGGVPQETIALNEATLWSGQIDPEQEVTCGKEKLAEIRKLFFEGNIKEGNELAARHLVGFPHSFGSHLPFGNLILDFNHQASPSGYRRSLDLQQALSTVTYTISDTVYTREVFCSNPDQVLAIRITSDKKNAISLNAHMQMLREADMRIENESFLLTGKVNYPKFGKGGVEFAGSIRFNAEGGKVIAHDSLLQIVKADEVVILADINTNLLNEKPADICSEHIAHAFEGNYEAMRRRHTDDFSRLFNRTELSLGMAKENLPTNERLEQAKKNVADPDLAALFFQYGRYLLISSSRENSPLPANLQGVWNDNLACSMDWTCDYHLDVNIQQNYWLANIGNLSECNTPLFSFVDYLAREGSKTAQKVYGSPGWVAHTVVNVWGYTSPGREVNWGLHPTGGVWMASHLWEHYQYTKDKTYLQSVAYPLLKESARFFLDYMTMEPSGRYLMTGPSISPENSFLFKEKGYALSMMPTCDLVLVRDLFTACSDAAIELDCDTAFRDSLQQSLSVLPPLQIGRYGQLQEWFEDYEEAMPNHRHTAHLLALHPFAQITLAKTPDLAHAAAVSIERRLNAKDWEDVEWSRANLINYYARLKEADKALASVNKMLTEISGENMLTISAKGIGGAPWDIFMLDGNEAGAAGIAEMLLQCHEGYIELLPSLPAEWNIGHFKGLRVRGGAEVSASWTNGVVKSTSLTATASNLFCLKLPKRNEPYQISLNGKPIKEEANANRLFSIQLEQGEILELK